MYLWHVCGGGYLQIGCPRTVVLDPSGSSERPSVLPQSKPKSTSAPATLPCPCPSSERTSGLKTIASILNGGGVCGIPSDTVYTLSASCEHPAAIQRIYNIKVRCPFLRPHAQFPYAQSPPVTKQDRCVSWLSSPSKNPSEIGALTVKSKTAVPGFARCAYPANSVILFQDIPPCLVLTQPDHCTLHLLLPVCALVFGYFAYSLYTYTTLMHLTCISLDLKL